MKQTENIYSFTPYSYRDYHLEKVIEKKNIWNKE